MKVAYIPFKKSSLINIMFIAIMFLALLLIDVGKTITVATNTSRDPIYKGNEVEKMVAFECNVVWGTEFISQMLEIFSDNDIKITFFIGGDWAKENPILLNQMVDEGHEIGNHGYSHKHHNQLDVEGNRNEILKTEQVIESITGNKTTLFAPPYGEYNDITLQAAESLGYKTIMWSIDTIDWRRDGVNSILKRVFKDPHNGAMVLMHPTQDTVTALPIMINQFKELGYKVGSVSDVIADK